MHAAPSNTLIEHYQAALRPCPESSDRDMVCRSMRSFPRWLVAVAVVGGSALAPAASAAAPASPGVRCERGVELLAPQAAIPLAAGSTAVLEWEPLSGLAALPAREEWETFLSLDGGKNRSVRITPHLDSDLRRTVWEVPGVPS